MDSIANREWIAKELNHKDKKQRLQTLDEVHSLISSKEITRKVSEEVNNHVHTTYSFSPYEPAAAAWAAWNAELGIVGSVDHESVGAAYEMLAATKALGMGGTVGFEIRSNLFNSPFGKRTINSPDSLGIAYVCVHGIPANAIDRSDEFLRPIRKERNLRNRVQLERLNAIIVPMGLAAIDFESDLLPSSHYDEGGSVTERHILYILVRRLMESYPKRNELVAFLENRMQVPVEGKMKTMLLDENNPHRSYDLLGLLKSHFLPHFYVQPSEHESVDIRQVVDFALSIGAIPAYAYLGDVGQSVTGDKKAQQFEDEFLDELIAYLVSIGFPAITYMPPRNSAKQMLRLQRLCHRYDLMEISGVDINSSRQSFRCPELLSHHARHLVDAAWALVAHEQLSTLDKKWGLFAQDNPLVPMNVRQRISQYSDWARQTDPFEPERILEIAEQKNARRKS